MTPPPMTADVVDRLRPLLRAIVGPDQPVAAGAVREVLAITLDEVQTARLADALERLAADTTTTHGFGPDAGVHLPNPGETGGGSLDEAERQAARTSDAEVFVERHEATDLLSTTNSPEDVHRAQVHATLFVGDQVARLADVFDEARLGGGGGLYVHTQPTPAAG